MENRCREPQDTLVKKKHLVDPTVTPTRFLSLLREQRGLTINYEVRSWAQNFVSGILELVNMSGDDDL